MFYSTTSKKNLHRIDVLQNSTANLCGGHTTIKALRIEAREPSLNLQRKFFATKYVYKSIGFSKDEIILIVSRLPIVTTVEALKYISNGDRQLLKKERPNCNFF